MTLKIGTRKSALALAQAHEVREKLAAAWPDLELEVVPMMTSGDTFLDQPLADIGGKGLFTKEIEEALLSKHIDIAVHSIKDMQTLLPAGLTLGCILMREDPRDVLVGKNVRSLDELPLGATFGTSSLRRSAQLLMKRPDINIAPLRGNVQTRLKKIETGEIDFTMLAQAGLNRLKLFQVPGFTLSLEEFLPAVAQGAIGIECRQDDKIVLDFIAPLADIESETAILCERAFLHALDGSCRTPIAGFATIEGESIHLRGLVISPDGTVFHTIDEKGNSYDAALLGEFAGAKLRAKM